MIRMSMFVALCLSAGTTYSASILQGNRELGVSGTIDFDTADDTLVALSLSYGIFPVDYLEVGARTGFRVDDRVTQWHLGGFTEFHIYTGDYLVPFIGASLDLAGAEVSFGDIDEDNTAAVLGAVAGVKYFLNTHVAVSTSLNFEFATDDIFPSDDGADDNNWDIRLGLRFYF